MYRLIYSPQDAQTDALVAELRAQLGEMRSQRDAATWPLTATTQQTDRLRRIGLLMGGFADAPRSKSIVAGIRDTLRERGWMESRNLQLEYRWAGGEQGRVQAYAEELVNLRPDVILCGSAPTLVALRNHTKEIPIVFVFVSDPVGMGQIESLARPGGNATGFTPFAPSLGSKWTELAKELSPAVTHISIMFNPDTAPNAMSFVRSAEGAAAPLNVRVSRIEVRNDAEIERALGEIARASHPGLIAIPDPFTLSRAELIGSLAIHHSMPLVAPFRDYVMAGGIASYGVNVLDEYRRATTYVDRILRGEKPAELPVQAPSKFELVINMKTAQIVGLNVPVHLQQLTDEVIE